jgi:hypothetical protein
MRCGRTALFSVGCHQSLQSVTASVFDLTSENYYGHSAGGEERSIMSADVDLIRKSLLAANCEFDCEEALAALDRLAAERKVMAEMLASIGYQIRDGVRLTPHQADEAIILSEGRQEKPSNAAADLIQECLSHCDKSDAALGALDRFRKLAHDAGMEAANSWSPVPPTKWGFVWHWSGDPDESATLMNIAIVQTTGKAMVLHNFPGQSDCEKLGGYWQPLRVPETSAQKEATE